MTEEEKKLEKEIEEKQQKLHELRYGEIDKAYNDFEKARDNAMEKYNIWKEASLKHGRAISPLTIYFSNFFR
ncbi:hypothetical protein N9M66_04420 [Litoreibacter sp.]|jgi:hypothetical protein|nr:hypothetical protein [Litoreibacter sp.]